jgi:hypothetical protein
MKFKSVYNFLKNLLFIEILLEDIIRKFVTFYSRIMKIQNLMEDVEMDEAYIIAAYIIAGEKGIKKNPNSKSSI